MIAIMALALLQAAPLEAGWSRQIAWGCRITPADGPTNIVNGYIYTRPTSVGPVASEALDYAILVENDGSGRWQGKGARGLDLVLPRAGEYWANFSGSGGDGFVLILDGTEETGTGRIIFRAAVLSTSAGARVAAAPNEGECEYRRRPVDQQRTRP